MSQNSYQLITLTGDIVLSWPTSFPNGPVVADINNVTTAANGFTITFPNSTAVPNGTTAVFNNISGYSFTILASDGVTDIATVTTGQIVNIYLNNNSTANGVWNVIPYGGGAAAITTFTAESTNNSITITGGTVTAPDGTINFELPTSLTNLNSVAAVGFPSIATYANGIATWSSNTITAGSNITITNGNGVAGNPIVALNATVAGLTSAGVGNFNFSGSTLTPVNANSGYAFNSNGNGSAVSINGITVDTGSNIVTSGNLTVNGSFKNSLTPKAWVLFTDTIIGISNMIVLRNYSNVTSITGGAGSYTINFANALSTNYYGVLVTAGTDIGGGGLPISSQGFSVYTAQTTTSCQITVVDASGQFVKHAPFGITVQILSSS